MTGIDIKPTAQGKVRDLYDLGDKMLLVASDRISAFDYILEDEIPYKGQVLTQLSCFWFELLDGVAREVERARCLQHVGAKQVVERSDVLGGLGLVEQHERFGAFDMQHAAQTRLEVAVPAIPSSDRAEILVECGQVGTGAAVSLEIAQGEVAAQHRIESGEPVGRG